MITTIDISDRIYSILNIDAVKSMISGDIFKGSKPEEITQVPKVEYIMIVPLTSLNTPVGMNVCNVNIYVPDLSNGIANETKLKQIATAVLSALQNYTSNTDYFFIDMTTVVQRVIRDDNNTSFMNLRLQILTS